MLGLMWSYRGLTHRMVGGWGCVWFLACACH